ncbi:pre-mRNA-processing factor 17 [[Candida] anglica]|uniref:Pre-mRNA-processing factor 17 n=1 Tax=[Candida] anglica TaxID=148631 RepID=A0ABP0ENU3_9ASCO
MSLVPGYSSDSSGDSDAEVQLKPSGVEIPILPVSSLDPAPQVVHRDTLINSNIEPTINSFSGNYQKQFQDVSIYETLTKRSSKSNNDAAKKLKKRRKQKGNVEDDDYLGPWAGYQDSSEEEEIQQEDIKLNSNISNDHSVDSEFESESESESEPRSFTELFVPTTTNFMDPPQSVLMHKFPKTCYASKRITFKYSKIHEGGVTKLQLSPKSSHLLLSCGNDSKIFLWDVYRHKKLLRGYYGHTQAVRDISFDSTGTRFLSCSYDKWVILWDTESGEIISKYKMKSTPNVAIFNPHNELQFIVGLANHKIEHYDTSITEPNVPIQTYTHHIGAINSLTVVDDSTKFMSTADDKSVRFWEWQVNIPVKVIADPSSHSMPAAALLPPDGQFIALQSMDNTIQVIQGHGKFKFSSKKVFQGHNVAGYGIDVGFSADGKYIYSGDSRGFIYCWDWKSCRVVNKTKIDKLPITCLQAHPSEPSKTIVAGLSGQIYVCD